MQDSGLSDGIIGQMCHWPPGHQLQVICLLYGRRCTLIQMHIWMYGIRDRLLCWLQAQECWQEWGEKIVAPVFVAVWALGQILLAGEAVPVCLHPMFLGLKKPHILAGVFHLVLYSKHIYLEVSLINFSPVCSQNKFAVSCCLNFKCAYLADSIYIKNCR